MARRPPQQGQKLIDQQAASGQTATAFCAARGINNKYFSLQKNKLVAENRKPAKKIDSKFIAVSTQPLSSPVISLLIGAVQLRVPANSTPQWLAALIRELN